MEMTGEVENGMWMGAWREAGRDMTSAEVGCEVTSSETGCDVTSSEAGCDVTSASGSTCTWSPVGTWGIGHEHGDVLPAAEVDAGVLAL